jgi:hypothetical protein
MLDGKDGKVLGRDIAKVGLVRDGKGAATKVVDASSIFEWKSDEGAKQNYRAHQDDARYCDIG